MEFAEKVRRIPTYPAAAGYGATGPLVRLASNESPDPPRPEVVEAATQAIRDANRYPDPTASRLRAALSDRTGVPVQRIAIGNGSCDILLTLGEALLEPGAEVVYAWPSFSVYPQLAAASGARALEVPLDADDTHDLDALAREVTVVTRMVVVCNPNNPTSTALPLAPIADFVAQVPRSALVVLDEAYCEFNLLYDPEESVELLARHPNLIILRTFSKAYGMAGLRVGYGLAGDEAVVRAVDAIRQPFYCSVAAQAAAVEALRHGDDLQGRVERTVAGRLELVDGLRDLGIEPAESHANFVWLPLPREGSEPEIMRGLAEQGVLVRGGASLGRADWLRVSTGTSAEHERFLAALAPLL